MKTQQCTERTALRCGCCGQDMTNENGIWTCPNGKNGKCSYTRNTNSKTIEVYYEIERKEINPDDSFYWTPLNDSRSFSPNSCEGKKTWRCVKVTTTREVVNGGDE